MTEASWFSSQKRPDPRSRPPRTIRHSLPRCGQPGEQIIRSPVGIYTVLFSHFRLRYEQDCRRPGTTVRLRLKCHDTRAETIFRLSAKRMSPFKSVGTSVQSTTGSRGVRISGDNAGYTVFRGSVKGTGYPLHSPVSLSILLPCVTVCHHISTGLYLPPSPATSVGL